MSDQNIFPKTLQAAIQYFSDEERCIQFLAMMRWPNGAECPHCHEKNATYLATQKRWKCKTKECRKQFSVKVGSIFEDSPISLTKWFPAMWLICGAKNGISSYEIARALGITQKSAWFMMHRIRLAMQVGSFEKMSGEVEADETFIGGLARNMHQSKRDKLAKMGEGFGKTVVLGLLERHGPDKTSRVRAKVIPTNSAMVLRREVRDAVESGSNLYTDEYRGYKKLGEDYQHEFINHAEEYARGRVSTNGIENFWSLLKRAIKGTYVSIEPFHMFRYLDEQSFRFNERSGDDADRFLTVLAGITGKRVTYRKLTGKEEVGPSVNGEGSEIPESWM